MSQPTLIIHGGAGNSFGNRSRILRIQKKIKAILQDSYSFLLQSNALEAVVYAVMRLENDPDFNAGTGSMLQADGKARLSAAVMDGKLQRFAGVINVENIRNPILIAKNLLKEKDRVLCTDGALRYAKKLGMKPFDARTAESIRRWKKRRGENCDTVGACALDSEGNLASATSTGGRGFEFPGRVSDSAMPAGNYANEKCAVSATGIGEQIIDQGLAVKIVTRVADGKSLKQAFAKSFAEVRSSGHNMGAIGLDFKGRIALAATTPSFIYGWKIKGKEKIF